MTSKKAKPHVIMTGGTSCLSQIIAYDVACHTLPYGLGRGSWHSHCDFPVVVTEVQCSSVFLPVDRSKAKASSRQWVSLDSRGTALSFSPRPLYCFTTLGSPCLRGELRSFLLLSQSAHLCFLEAAVARSALAADPAKREGASMTVNHRTVKPLEGY